MQLIVRAFPVLAGKEKEIHQFAQDLRNRATETADFYQRMGVARESWHLQETPQGAWVIAVTQIPVRPIEIAAKDFAESQQTFDQWFKQQVVLVTGVNPEATPLGPPTQCIFDTHPA